MIIEYDTYTGKIVHVRIGIDTSWTEEDRTAYLSLNPGRGLLQTDSDYENKVVQNGALVEAQFFAPFVNKETVLSDGVDEFIASNIPEGTLVYDNDMNFLGEVDSEEVLEATFEDPGFYKFHLRKGGYEWYSLGVNVT